jgi:hypothetical protein
MARGGSSTSLAFNFHSLRRLEGDDSHNGVLWASQIEDVVKDFCFCCTTLIYAIAPI